LLAHVSSGALRPGWHAQPGSSGEKFFGSSTFFAGEESMVGNCLSPAVEKAVIEKAIMETQWISQCGRVFARLISSIMKRRSLLSNYITQALTVFVIVFGAGTGAHLRQPLATHRVLEGAAFTVDCPYSVAQNGKAAEPATTSAAGMRQARAACCGPVEHLDLEIVRIPSVFNHIGDYPTSRCELRPADG
jgi:hypothetical protein